MAKAITYRMTYVILQQDQLEGIFRLIGKVKTQLGAPLPFKRKFFLGRIRYARSWPKYRIYEMPYEESPITHQ